jgi:urease accessory protein
MADLPPIPSPSAKADPWLARLKLGFSGAGGRTRVVRREHEGPLRIQRPFYPEEDGTCHVYLLHPPGGVVGGDQLRLEARAEGQAHTVITNPAATKLYRSGGGVAHVRQELRVVEGSFLEWLPQETIAFQGAEAKLETVVELDQTSQFVGWEVLCLGRPAAREEFERGNVSQRFEVWRDGTPIYLDRSELGERSPTRRAAWGLDGAAVLGTMIVASSHAGILNVVRQSLLSSKPDPHQGHLGATGLDGVTLVRYVGPSVPACWSAFVSVWCATRPMLSGTSASAPRIWNC